MNVVAKKFIVYVALFGIVLVIFPQRLLGDSAGKTARTLKNSSVGCGNGSGGCHGNTTTASLLATINGPGTLQIGQIATYTVVVAGVPGSGGGVNIAVSSGGLNPVSNFLRLDLTNGELTHTAPQTVTTTYTFSYTAPVTAGSVTMYAIAKGGGSFNAWNWAPNKAISITAKPTISRTPPAMPFSATVGGDNPPPQTLQISNSGGGTLNWTASDNQNWLSLTPTSGSSIGGATNNVTVSVNIASLPAGTHSGRITIIDPNATNSPQFTDVTLNLAAPAPSITRNPGNMFFTAVVGSTTPLNQTLQISNGGGGTLNWNVTDNQSWITLNSSSGSSTGEADPVTVTVNPSGLPVGTHTGLITITAAGASNSPQTTSVQLVIIPTPVSTDFLDDFSDGNANGWAPQFSSRWRVNPVNGNNAYCIVSPNRNADEFSYLGTTTWDNFVMELDARAQVNGDYFIMFNARDTTSTVGYQLQFRTFPQTQVNLYGCASSPCSSITRDFVSDGQYHHIRIERKKPSIKVFADNQFVFEHFDSTYTVGYIGLGAFSGLAHFDNIKIAALTSFSDINAVAFTAVNRSAMAWGDYDNDTRLDLLLTGQDLLNTSVARIFRNTGAGFSNVTSAGLRGVKDGAVAWGDYDNDGDLDILLSGDPSN
ncbi:MAG: choice-of-anchor V domain-containing protein, partial [candidate division KSB1 bacterium]